MNKPQTDYDVTIYMEEGLEAALKDVHELQGLMLVYIDKTGGAKSVFCYKKNNKFPLLAGTVLAQDSLIRQINEPDGECGYGN